MSVERNENGFADRLEGYLQKADYRLAVTEADKLDIYKLRYKSYFTESAIEPSATREFRDAYDDLENCWTFGVYIDDVLVSSVRFHVLTADTPYGPASDFFPDIVRPMLDDGMVLIDPTRFVSDPAVRHVYRELPYVTVRVPAMAYEHFNADFSLASVRREHQAFYKRLFNAETLTEPRPYPPLTVRLALMRLRLDQSREKLLNRYPIFSSSLTERRLMFQTPTTAQELGNTTNDSRSQASTRLVS